MDKDRDISRRITISTSKKVSFVGSAVLAGSALLAACGGGSSKPVRTPEGGVAGVAVQPSTGASPIIVETAMPSATAVIEAPTATATTEARLTQEQIVQAKSEIKSLITSTLSDKKPTVADLNKTNDPNAQNEMLDPIYIAKQFTLCDMSRYGETFGPPEIVRTVDPSEGDYSTIFLGACAKIAATSKVLFEATGDPSFKKANDEWKPVHRQIFGQIRAKDQTVSEGLWNSYLNLYYIKG